MAASMPSPPDAPASTGSDPRTADTRPQHIAAPGPDKRPELEQCSDRVIETRSWLLLGSRICNMQNIHAQVLAFPDKLC